MYVVVVVVDVVDDLSWLVDMWLHLVRGRLVETKTWDAHRHHSHYLSKYTIPPTDLTNANSVWAKISRQWE